MLKRITPVVRVKFLSMDAVLNAQTVERVVAADTPVTAGNVEVNVITDTKFSTRAELEAMICRWKGELKNRYKSDSIEFYVNYATRTKQFSKKERYLLSARMRLRRLSYEKALSIPLQTAAD